MICQKLTGVLRAFTRYMDVIHNHLTHVLRQHPSLTYVINTFVTCILHARSSTCALHYVCLKTLRMFKNIRKTPVLRMKNGCATFLCSDICIKVKCL